jgi:hypothetical protein
MNMEMTYIIKVEIDGVAPLHDALETLVEEHDASFYTLVEEGRGVNVHEYSSHLIVETFEGALYAAAREMFETMLDRGIHPRTSLVETYERMVEFLDDENGRQLLARYRAQGG